MTIRRNIAPRDDRYGPSLGQTYTTFSSAIDLTRGTIPVAHGVSLPATNLYIANTGSAGTVTLRMQGHTDSESVVLPVAAGAAVQVRGAWREIVEVATGTFSITAFWNAPRG
jgi:hypothetical protein